jgi:hypothetical protein
VTGRPRRTRRINPTTDRQLAISRQQGSGRHLPARGVTVVVDEQDHPLNGAVAGLAREVEAIRRALDDTATAAELDRLARVVADLTEMVGPPTSTDQATVSSWLSAPADGDQTRTMLGDLVGWLATIYLRYADAAKNLPECWLWHPDIVEELLWLHEAWADAYGESGSVRAAGDWHDRHRPGVVRRITEYAKACSLENHLPDRAGEAQQVPVVEAAEPIALWWAQARTERAPAPTDEQMIEAAAAARRTRTGGGR